MNVSFETTLGDLGRLVTAMRKFEDARAEIRVLASPQRRERLLKDYADVKDKERVVSNIIYRDLKPRYDAYELERDTIRSIIYTLKILPDIPTLSEYLQLLKDNNYERTTY